MHNSRFSILVEKLSEKELNGRINVFEPMVSCFFLYYIDTPLCLIRNVIPNEAAVSNAIGSLPGYNDQAEGALDSSDRRNRSSIEVTLNRSETVQAIRLDVYPRGADYTHPSAQNRHRETRKGSI